MSTRPNSTVSGVPVPIHLYDGAYGPTLRIDAQTQEALELVRDTFKTMSSPGAKELLLTTGSSYRLSGFDFLRLRLQNDGTGGKRLKQVRVGATSGFDWSCQTEIWRTYVGLIGGLFDYGRPSHQYLTEEGDNDALVEVAFMEAGPKGTG